MNRILIKQASADAYAKINLSLDVTGRRNDGYHLVKMVMQTVGVCDRITIRSYEPSDAITGRNMPDNEAPDKEQAGMPEISIVTGNGEIPAGPDNLMYRAAALMREKFGIQDSLEIEIVKRIPVAAGMAGGSTDAAAVLQLLRDMYVPDISDEELEKAGLALGADVPYCITGGTQLCEGIGEVLTRLPALPECALVIVKPDIYVSTGWVYTQFDNIPEEEVRHPDVDRQIKGIRDASLTDMCAACGNVLEQKTGAVYPVIGELEAFLEQRGAVRAMMTGSGPAVFAVFDTKEKAAAACRALDEKWPAYQKFVTVPVYPEKSEHTDNNQEIAKKEKE